MKGVDDMAPTSTNIKIDPVLKQESQALFESLGLSLSAAVNIFLCQAVREQAIPFRVGIPQPASSADYVKKLRQGLDEVHAGNGIVKSLDELQRMAGDEI